MDIAKLAAPFPPEVVSWRVGPTTGDKKSGMALAYIDARDVQDRFNEVCGPFGWQCRHEVSHDKRITCHIGVRNPETGEWVWKSDGAGETDHEAEKGSYSDSFKRAAVKWCVGRYLYDIDSPWVAIESKGKSYSIPKSERAKLNAILTKGNRPAPVAAPEPPAPAEAVVDADVYVDTALVVIGTFKDEQTALDWWADEATHRRQYGLSQGHVDVLKDAMAKKFKQKEAA